MRSLLIVPILITLLAGCGVIDKPQEGSRNYGIAVEVVSENKQDLEYIKNRTADDLELGYKAREAVIDGSFTDEQLGKFIRETAENQPTMPKKEETVEHEKCAISFWFSWTLVALIGLGIVGIMIGVIVRKK